MSAPSSLEEAGVSRARGANAVGAALPAPVSSLAPASVGEAEPWPASLDVRELARRWTAILVFLTLWEIAPRVGLISASYVPPFSVVAARLANGLLSGELVQHLVASLSRSLAGFALALGVGLPLGFALGWFQKFERFVDPLVQLIRQVPALALLPLFIMLLGVGELSKIVIIFYGAQWAIQLNTVSGVKNVDPLLIKLARSLGLSRSDLFRKIVLPAALPTIFTGLRLSATRCILIIVMAEMMGGKAGIGYVLKSSEYSYDIVTMYAAIMLLSLLGLATNYLLVALERHFTGWKPESTRY
ncbi:MAG TPA: ABC transporter permease [Polyangiaceae bacterium]|nr:ABC transporter permease [Polyangiaceae bacterium]